MMRRLLVPATLLAAVAAIGLTWVHAQGTARTGDWPQWRGPNRDGVLAAFTPPSEWPERLAPAWKVTVGLGYATPLVANQRVYMFARQESNEVMLALEAATGTAIWRSAYPAPVTMHRAAARHGEGPKSTPALADGRLFSLGYGGIVTAWDAATGRILWQKTGLASPTFGTAQSPIVDRGLVILHVGGNNNDGALSAFEAATGEERWSWRGDGPGYGSPMVADLGGTRQIIVQTQRNLVGVAVATGELLWQRPLTSPSQQNSITVILNGQTVITSALQNPLIAFTVARTGSQWTTTDAWSNPDVPLYMSNAVLLGGAIFGMTNRGTGQFFCVDAATGRTLWTSEPRQAANAAVSGGGNYVFFLKDTAELIVARASRTSFEPLRTYTVADSATWSAPSLVGQRIFVKDVSTLAAWDIKNQSSR